MAPSYPHLPSALLSPPAFRLPPSYPHPPSALSPLLAGAGRTCSTLRITSSRRTCPAPLTAIPPVMTPGPQDLSLHAPACWCKGRLE